MPRLCGSRAGNRARPKPASLSAMRLSLCATGERTATESARPGDLRGDGRRPEICGRIAIPGNGHIQRPPQKISREHRLARRCDQRIRNS